MKPDRSRRADPDQESHLFMITTYHPDNHTLQVIISHNWEILQRSSTTNNLGESCPVFGTSRPKNLRDHLVSAKVKTSQYVKTPSPCCKDINHCNTQQCHYCPIVDDSGIITSTTTGHLQELKPGILHLMQSMPETVCGPDRRHLDGSVQGSFWHDQ